MTCHYRHILRYTRDGVVFRTTILACGEKRPTARSSFFPVEDRVTCTVCLETERFKQDVIRFHLAAEGSLTEWNRLGWED